MTTSHSEFKQEVCKETIALQPELLVTQNINGCDVYDEEKNGAVKPVRSCISADAELQDSKKNMTAQSVHFFLSADAEFQDAKMHKTVKPVNICLLVSRRFTGCKEGQDC